MITNDINVITNDINVITSDINVITSDINVIALKNVKMCDMCFFQRKFRTFVFRTLQTQQL